MVQYPKIKFTFKHNKIGAIMRKIALVLATLYSTSVFAAGSSTIFSCTTASGKPLTVKQIGNNYEFSYNNERFTNPIQQIMGNENTYIAEGSGFITSSLQLKNNGYSYQIEFSEPRNNPIAVDDVVISVSKLDGSGRSQYIECNMQKKIQRNLNKNIMRKSV